VPHILRHGPGWFRSIGTPRSPGTVVATLSGDVNVEVVAEIPLGTPMRQLIEEVGGGVQTERRAQMVLNGVSNAPLTRDQLDTPISYEALEAAGSGLGSASFIVLDDSACPVQVAESASAFLHAGSCGQCTPCKLGTGAIRDAFAALRPTGEAGDVERIAAWTIRVTDANRCGLGAGQRTVAKGLLDRFPEHLAEHLDGATCGSDRVVTIDTIDDWDATAGRFVTGA
jgi:NADH-quinone oxidoreductase subunit F